MFSNIHDNRFISSKAIKYLGMAGTHNRHFHVIDKCSQGQTWIIMQRSKIYCVVFSL